MRRLSAVVLFAAVLAGCGSVVPCTIMALDRVDLMEADSCDLTVAVVLPQGVRA